MVIFLNTMIVLYEKDMKLPSTWLCNSIDPHVLAGTRKLEARNKKLHRPYPKVIM